MEGVVDHLPITEVAVFSKVESDVVVIGTFPVGENIPNVMVFNLVFHRKFKDWNEYRIRHWMKEVPNCLMNFRHVTAWKNYHVEREEMHSCMLTVDDRYGYFADESRMGYSVREGSDFL